MVLFAACWLLAVAEDVEAIYEGEAVLFGVVCEDAGLPLDFAAGYLILAFDDQDPAGDSG